MNPKLKAALYPLLAALLGALASYFATGCNPADVQHVRSAADAALIQAGCVRDAERKYDLETDPSLGDALKFAADVKACLKPAKPAPTPDAGA